MKKKILEWLYNEEILEKLCNNSYSSKFNLTKDLIYEAFDWYYSPEGFDFWHEKDKRYQEFFSQFSADPITADEIESFLQEMSNQEN